MITEFGKELRKLRIDRDETLATMAKKMGVSTSYLSAIENGLRPVPDGFMEKLIDKYKLSKKLIKTLEIALEHSLSSVDIPLMAVMPEQRDLALMLARKLPELSSEQCESLLALLKDD